MDDTLKQSLGLLIRHGMTAFAGVMGWTWFTSGDTTDAFVTVAVTLVALGWSFLQKKSVVSA
jgi:hypothetical protein